MKRLGVYLALCLPILLLAVWSAYPQADPRFAASLFHFYIVTFTTFAATVVSLFVTISVGETALPRHLLLAIAFAWMGGVFFIHGATTPGALISHFHPGLVWSAWLTLFGGGAIFLTAAFAPNHPSPRFLRRASLAILVVYLVYAATALLRPEILANLLALPGSPAVGDVIFFVTTLIWMAGSLKHYQNYRRSGVVLDGLMAFEAMWYATSTISMFRFPLWQASWWLYHVLLLAGFLVAIYALWRAYEQIRTFRLTRYYAATSLIVTAALALLSAHLYADLVFRSLRQQLERDTASISQYVANTLFAEWPEVDGAAALRALDQADLAAQATRVLSSAPAFNAAHLYDTHGAVLFSTMPAAAAPDDLEDFQATALGLTTYELLEPGPEAASYGGSGNAHMLETYVPVWPGGDPQAGAPIAVLVTLREAPELTQALIVSRGMGLALAALSLGGLFGALLYIVHRADQLITARTRELERAYSDLRQAEGMRDDLTRMIIHDLRGPLTAMTANIDLIGKTINNPSYSDAPPRFLASARAAGQRMMGLIDDLLNVGKFEAGELRPLAAPVYLPTLLNEKLESYRSQAEKEHKQLRVLASPELPVVMADPSLIGRVIDNLVSNAFKYTETGGHIEISAEHNGQSVVVRVCDDGQGIPAEYHGRIFEKFVQVTDHAGLPLRKGTGLGLAFCRLAVEAHGGCIRVDSAPGQGSTFSFNLPLNAN